MVVWTVTAKEDLRGQLEYIARDDPEAARAMAVRIKASCGALGQFSRVGREGMVKGTRELVIPGSPYVCVYRVVQGRVEILRLLHARMMWPA